MRDGDVRRLTWLGVVAGLGGGLVLGCFDAGGVRRVVWGAGLWGEWVGFCGCLCV